MSPASVPALSAAILIAGAAWVSPFLEPGSREARRGLERYESGDWVAAVEHFRKAGESDNDPILSYDLGAAAYQGQNYPEAQNAFEAAARAGGIPPGPANYNLGNARYRNGDLPGALEAYRNALRADPTDEDARFNYEWTLKQLAGGAPDSTEQSQDQGDGQDSEGNQDQNRSSPPDSSSESASSGSESSADQDQQAENRPENPEPGDEPRESSSAGEGTPPAEADSAAAARAGEATMLSPEEAAQLLNAVTPEERELIQARLKSARRRNAEKDW